MSIPTSGRPRDEATGAAPATAPVPVVPAPAPRAPRPAAAPRRESRLVVETGRFWAGAAATAFVAALVGIVGVLVLERILRLDLVVPGASGEGSAMGAYVVGGPLAVVAAAGLLQLLVLTTPRPRAFFGWIVGLGTAVATLIPLTWTDSAGAAIATGVVNLLLGIAVWSLLSGVLGWTVRRVTV